MVFWNVDQNCRPWIFSQLFVLWSVVSSDTRAIGIARLGQPDQCIAVGTLGELAAADLGAPLHSLVIPGETHFLEDDMLKFYREQWVAGRAMP
jgi:diphthamide biosynthesis methyltransferase